VRKIWSVVPIRTEFRRDPSKRYLEVIDPNERKDIKARVYKRNELSFGKLLDARRFRSIDSAMEQFVTTL
jgi:hypothetical protein